MGKAVFSEDRRYRYFLERELNPILGNADGGQTCTFLMLNPSTADETANDPTVARCIGYAKRWDCSRLIVVNLSPLRATDPKRMIAAGPEPDDVWQRNLGAIRDAAAVSDWFMAAYGNHGIAENRAERVLADLQARHTSVYVLGLTKQGHPRHPLYCNADLRPLLLWKQGAT